LAAGPDESGFGQGRKMKKEVSPAMVVAAVVVALAVIGGLFYKTLGPGARSAQSKAASPQGIPTSAADFQRPRLTGSGVNSITGEPLSASAQQAAQTPAMGGLAPPPAAAPK
jgi:hypothetical protein